MKYSVKMLILVILLGISTCFLFSCTNIKHYKNQFLNKEKNYLYADELDNWKIPPGIFFPLNDNYHVPNTLYKSDVGESIDIRPPKQPLVLLKSSSVQIINDNIGIITIKNILKSRWSEILKVLEYYKIPIINHDNNLQELTTDWVKWNKSDKYYQYSARYKIKLINKKYDQLLAINLLELKQKDKLITTLNTQRQIYLVEMMNNISEGLNKIYSIKK